MLLYFESLKIKTITLEVLCSNLKAIHLYKHFGFIPNHIKKNYYKKEDAVFMIKGEVQ
jgi:ribosomal protein S18 acetylase RimI-like enzyme